MTKINLFLFVTYVALFFKFTEPSYYFSGDILEAINSGKDSWINDQISTKSSFLNFYSLYEVPASLILFFKEKFGDFWLGFLSSLLIFASSLTFFFKPKEKGLLFPALLSSLIYVCLLNLSLLNPLKCLGMAVTPWVFHFFEKATKENKLKDLFIFTLIIFAGIYLDFSIIILGLFLLLTGAFSSLLSFGSFNKSKALLALAAVLLFFFFYKSIPSQIALSFQNPSLSILNYYAFRTPNFHINFSLPLTFCLLLALKTLFPISLDIKTRIELLISLLLGLFINGAEFIFVFLAAKVIFNAVSSKQYNYNPLLSVFILPFLFFYSGNFWKKEVSQNLRPEASKELTSKLKSLKKLEQIRILNTPNLTYLLRQNDIPYFVDEKKGPEFGQLKKVFQRPESYQEIFEQTAPSHTLLFKSSSLVTFLIESGEWKIAAESLGKVENTVTFLGSKVDRNILLLERVN